MIKPEKYCYKMVLLLNNYKLMPDIINLKPCESNYLKKYFWFTDRQWSADHDLPA